MTFDKVQLTLVLGLYYIDKSKNIESFTSRFNRYFHLSISAQTILFALAQFKNVDPATNTKVDGDNALYQVIWQEYIQSDNLTALKELYRAFKQEKYLTTVESLDDKLSDIEIINSTILSKVVDSPEEKPTNIHSRGTEAYPRLKQVVNNALREAQYKCENSLCCTPLFIRRDGKTNYTEAHHLIPLCYQDSFDFSLDVEANVVSLCPNCHCLLHYGQDKEALLRQLYDSRAERLKKCNLNVGFEDLMLMYR